MKKLKLMTILDSRMQLIRLSEVIKKANRYFEHIFVHTGQKLDYALNKILLEDLGLRDPDYYLEAAGQDPGETMASIIGRSYKLIDEVKPDALLIMGDTDSALSAIAARRLQVPIFHIEAGNRYFHQNLAEETNRRLVAHIADVHLCFSEHARRFLNQEGIASERTFVIGSTMAEVLSGNINSIENSQVLERLGLEPGRYIILFAQREGNISIEDHFLSLLNGVNAIAERYNMPVITRLHPQGAKIIEERGFTFHPNVRWSQPFGFVDFNNLQLNAFCVISDSWTLAEEANYFKFPAVYIRTNTVRPEAMEEGNFILTSATTSEFLQAVDLALAMAEFGEVGENVSDYTDESVSTKVIKIIQSYAGIINRRVWGN